MTDGFDLRVLIRDVCDSSTIADPATLAKEVSKRIGRNQQREALEQALPVMVLNIVSRMRSGGSESPSSGQLATDAHTARAAGRSNKVTGIRMGWRRHLRDRVPVGRNPSEWKFLIDCGVHDLTYARDVRYEHAAAVKASGDRFDLLIDQLVRHDAATVGDLPDEVLGDTLASAA